MDTYRVIRKFYAAANSISDTNSVQELSRLYLFEAFCLGYFNTWM